MQTVIKYIKLKNIQVKYISYLYRKGFSDPKNLSIPISTKIHTLGSLRVFMPGLY